MTCAPGPATFRLLDAYVGWDQDQQNVERIVGFTDPAGIRLAHSGSSPEGPTRSQLLPWFPDRRLAPGCQPCAWYLLAGARLTRRDECAGGWKPVWSRACDPGLLRDPISVAARGHRVAVVDSGRVLVWRNEGEQLAGVIRLGKASLAALAPDDEVLVARDGRTDLARFSSDGRWLGALPTGADGRVVGIRSGPCRSIWLLSEDNTGFHIHVSESGGKFNTATLGQLAAAIPPSSLVSAGDEGFCLTEPGHDGPVTSCYTWQGEPRPEEPPMPQQYERTGSMVTTKIDSGISRCRWHRVRVDAQVPTGTAVTVQIVVSEDDNYADSDWQTAPPGTTDFLIDQPPGRFLTLRLGMSGDGSATPVVSRIRLDFPRVTSADLLPPAYRQDPVADDFTERFLSLFDATMAEIDRVIERYPALLDPAGVPDRALPWLAGLLGLSFEAGWDARTRRALLKAAPALYRRRGTPWAIEEAARIVFGVTPVINELATDRRWAHTGGKGPGLGAVRLFGRSASRFRIGGSALGAAPLRAFGNPDSDPITEHAYRFRVLLPAGSADEKALRRLVERQAPAHTVGSVRTGGVGFVVGSRSTVGVDTAFVPLPPPVLGGLRLNRDGVIRPGPRGPRRGVSVGVVSAVGVHTQMS
ncbi:phage tail-like protein [Kibdelosporangium banguiense]|uniref:Phage tail-like protein n=1 Tax=Kibdelosporangium banguiense TaxID=1365924 RepID=A0ABS4U2H4_9PSEU|nr:phage tail protein [Kibdelosporangium banguiense]MBP2330395.1 phage tail-like protein [Kibdelosporangium banguiense]